MFNYKAKSRPYRSYLDIPDEDPTWYSYSRSTKQPYNRYKLHVCIPSDAFSKVQEEIHHILHMALKNHWIAQYKTLDVKLACQENPSTTDQETLRAIHNPFVIYLNDTYDRDNFYNIARMCFDIEDILLNVTPEKVSFHAPCDLPLTEHLIFRQAFLNADTTKTHYIKALDPKYMDQLAREGRESMHYKELFNLYWNYYPPSFELKTPSDKMNSSTSVEVGFFGISSNPAVTKIEPPGEDVITGHSKELGTKKKPTT